MHNTVSTEVVGAEALVGGLFLGIGIGAGIVACVLKDRLRAAARAKNAHIQLGLELGSSDDPALLGGSA